MHQISKACQIKANRGKGSEYFVVNVKYGVSRLEVNGTSLVNHANADAIMVLLRQMLLENI